MRPLPQWLILTALLASAVIGAWSHWYDRRYDRPLDWDPTAWRTWLARHHRIPVIGFGKLRRVWRRAVRFAYRVTHRRRRSHA